MSQQSEIVLWEPKPGLTISLQKDTVLLGQGKGKVIAEVAKLLSRLARLYQIPNWTVEQSVDLADWVYENYKFELSDLVVRVLSNPPPSEKENWRLTPDTISKWMTPAIERQAERFEQEHQKRKLLPEPISELPDKYLNEMKEIIDNSEGPVTKSYRMSMREMIKEGKVAKPNTCRPSTMEEVIMHDLHLQWIRQCFDPITGKPNANWISEDEFLRIQK